ncbi:MAG: ATP-binding protein [bacterium]
MAFLWVWDTRPTLVPLMDKKYNILTFLFCGFFALPAQLARAQLEEQIVFPKFYTFHAGDPAGRDWAQPDFDDNDWLRVDSHSFPLDDWQGIGWFRFVYEVDSTLWYRPLGLSMNYAGAVEFYLDGELLYQFGTVGNSKETEHAHLGDSPPRVISFRPPSPPLAGKSRHIVAFRYSSFFFETPVWPGDWRGFGFNIGDLDQMIAERETRKTYLTLHQMFLMGTSLALALLHLTLFFFYPKTRINLYYAVMIGCFSFLPYLMFQRQVGNAEILFTDPNSLIRVTRLYVIVFTLLMLSGLRFTYSVVYPRRPRVFLLFCFVGAGLTVFYWFRPFAPPYRFIFYVAAFVEMLRVFVVAHVRKQKLVYEGSWIILLGLVPLAVIIIYYMLALEPVAIVPLVTWDMYDFPTPLYAMLILMISMSIFLARNFAWTSKNLEAKLVQVQELSEKTLQQELEQARLNQELELEHIHAEKLQEIDRMKSRFFANISHEFRTPLTLILGPLEKLLSEKFQEPVKKQFRIMLRNGRRLLRLINQLLDLSKLEAGSMSLEARPENIVQLLKGIVLSFSSLAERKRITLRFQPPQPCEGAEPSQGLTLYVDRDKLEKIVSNLLSNAFKFTPEGGEISVEVETNIPLNPPSKSSKGDFKDSHLKGGSRRVSTADFVQITVSDSGAGIAPEKVTRIFDRFYQADDTYTREQEGSGIGLALTKELVELHHGEIQVASEVGKGTTFTVRLPLGKDHLKSEEIIAQPPPSYSAIEGTAAPSSEDIGEGATVVGEPCEGLKPSQGSEGPPLLLIVEDNADVRSYIRDYLESNYQIMEAVDGEEGFERSVDTIPDLIISDVMMPKMNGYELCRKLKTDERTSHIPIILLTARAGGESKVEGLETGADDYIIKPFDARELQVRVKNLIAQRHKLRERFRKEAILEPKEIAVTSMDEQFLRKAMDIIEQNLSDPEFSTERFARQVAMSRSQLHRKLHALTDHSTHEFIRVYRLKRAAELLQHQAGTVTEICYDVGFNSLSHFAKAFREQFGQSPSEFGAAHSELEGDSGND